MTYTTKAGNIVREQIQRLVEKSKDWEESWTADMMYYEEEDNLITVYVGRLDVYKAFFDADTLECLGTKC